VTGPAPATAPLLARLRDEFPDSSTRRLKEWLAEGRVRVNGAVVRDPRAPVRIEDALDLGPPAAAAFPSELGRVHEDDVVLVVDKPPGLLTIATERERERTVNHLLWEYLAARRPPRRPFVVHRLDRETSGLLVFATTPAAKRHLQAQFEQRSARRLYVAVVEGRVRDDAGTLTSRLVQDRGLCVRPGRGAGRTAITHYRVLARGSDATLLELRLGTGRRHQLRVQLAELGHSIVGDRLHGSARNPLRRLCLHATQLGFLHPETDVAVTFTSPVPPAFRRLAGVH
jgi:23S rRNA pseudouridine1911/1915/1917 synthase